MISINRIGFEVHLASTLKHGAAELRRDAVTSQLTRKSMTPNHGPLSFDWRATSQFTRQSKLKSSLHWKS